MQKEHFKAYLNVDESCGVGFIPVKLNLQVGREGLRRREQS